MEDQIESIRPIVNPPIVETTEKKSSKKGFIIGFILLLILIPVVMFGFQYFGRSGKNPIIVVNQKNTPSTVPSFSANDTSSSQIDKDIQMVDTELNNLDSSLDSVDQGINDTQTNLE